MPTTHSQTRPLYDRADHWAATSVTTTVTYQIVVEAEADVLCRVLNHFAQQYLTPQHVSALRQDTLMLIDIHQPDISWHRANVIAANLRGLISVCSVELNQVVDQASAMRQSHTVTAVSNDQQVNLAS